MFQYDTVKIGLAEHTLRLQVERPFLLLVKETAVLQFQMTAPLVALCLNITLVHSSDTGRKDKLVHQFIRNLAFVSLEQTGQVEHRIDVKVRPLHFILPIWSTVSGIHRITISKPVLLFAEALGTGRSELGFDTETWSKPLTEADTEIRRQLFRKFSQSSVITKESMSTYITQHKPVGPKTVGYHAVSVVRRLCLRESLTSFTLQCITAH